MPCLDENVIVAYAEGQLAARERPAVEAHLDSCAPCRQLLTGLLALQSSDDRPTGSGDRSRGGSISHASTLMQPRAGAAATARAAARATAERLALWPGTMVDHYRLEHPIGEGASGSVFVAHDTLLNRRVALKLIGIDRPADPFWTERAMEEARTTAAFSHPNIVTIHAVGQYRGYPYLALELIEGQTLRQRLADGALGLAESTRVGRGIAAALRHAHEAGVVHGDLKPENTLIGGDERLRVVDFGLAALLAREASAPAADGERAAARDDAASAGGAAQSDALRTRLITGTPAYMSPEQWRGVRGHPAADIWALGVILCETLTGRRPHREVRDLQHLEALVCSPGPVVLPVASDRVQHSALWRLARRCLVKDPDRRPSAAEVNRLLERAERAGGRMETIGDGGFKMMTPTPQPVGQRATLLDQAAEESRTVPLSSPADQSSGTRAAGVTLLVHHLRGVELVPLAEGEQLVLGRSHEADVPVDDPSLSRRHAQFSVTDGTLEVQDLGSTNGVSVGGARVPRAVVGLDLPVRLGSVVVMARRLSPKDLELYRLDTHESFKRVLSHCCAQSRLTPVSLLLVRAEPGQVPTTHLAAQVRKVVQGPAALARFGRAVVSVVAEGVDAARAVELGQAVTELQLEGAAPRAAASPLCCAAATAPDVGRSAEALIQRCLAALQRTGPKRPFIAAQATAWSERPGEQVEPRPVIASVVLRSLYREAERAAATDTPVLITGETGTGKETLAMELHRRSRRARGPLVSISCGAVAPRQLEAALFGRSGPVERRDQRAALGALRAASGGTLVLRGVDDLPLETQGALMRVLETGQVHPTGAQAPVQVDLRLVALTQGDLRALVRRGTFRDDLLYGLAAITLAVPPLRERREEIPDLAHQFLRQASEGTGRPPAIDREAMALLCRHRWPGNVRELRNVIQQALLLAEGPSITPQDLPRFVHEAARAEQRPREAVSQRTEPDAAPPQHAAPPLPGGSPTAHGAKPMAHQQRVRLFECVQLLRALDQADGQLTAAARALAISEASLANKLRVYGIGQGQRVDPAPLHPDAVNIPDSLALARRVRRFERAAVSRVLGEVDGDRTLAAGRLGMTLAALEIKLRTLGLETS